MYSQQCSTTTVIFHIEYGREEAKSKKDIFHHWYDSCEWIVVSPDDASLLGGVCQGHPGFPLTGAGHPAYAHYAWHLCKGGADAGLPQWSSRGWGMQARHKGLMLWARQAMADGSEHRRYVTPEQRCGIEP